MGPGVAEQPFPPRCPCPRLRLEQVSGALGVLKQTRHTVREPPALSAFRLGGEAESLLRRLAPGEQNGWLRAGLRP